MILVTHILLSKANYLKCTFAAFMVPLYGLYGSAVKNVCVVWHKSLRKAWNVPP